jgi:hypothetical protein
MRDKAAEPVGTSAPRELVATLLTVGQLLEPRRAGNRQVLEFKPWPSTTRNDTNACHSKLYGGTRMGEA